MEGLQSVCAYAVVARGKHQNARDASRRLREIVIKRIERQTLWGAALTPETVNLFRETLLW